MVKDQAETKFVAGEYETKSKSKMNVTEYVTIYSSELTSRKLKLHPLNEKGKRNFVSDQQTGQMKRIDDLVITDTIIIYGRGESYKQNKMIAPYAITMGVTKRQWEQIKAEYAHTHFIKRGLIFSEDDVASAKAKAKDNNMQRLKNDFLTPKDLQGQVQAPKTTFAAGQF